MKSTPRAITSLVWVLLGAWGCGGAMAGDSLGVPVPQLPVSDGLLESPELQAVVDLQVGRRGSVLQDLLESPAPEVRARAAFALASVQDPTALESLNAVLSDPSPEVRRNAAFALGQLALSDGGIVLLAALAEEQDRGVRRRLIEALGKRGGLDTLSELLVGGTNPDEEVEQTLAVARAALREVRPPGVLELLTARLTHPDPEVRVRSAYYFGRAVNVTAWGELAPSIRAALDAYDSGDPAAMDLIQALGRLSDVPEDAARITQWMLTATDWRTRTNAASAMMSPRWLVSSEVQDALVLALRDPSEHVRVAASGSIALLMWTSEELLGRAEVWMNGPPEDWRAQAAFAAPFAALGSGGLVIDWTRRMAAYHPAAAVRGIENLGGLPAQEVVELLFELAEHSEASVRAAAINALGQRWARGAVGDVPAARLYDLFVRRLGDPDNLPAARAAMSLSHLSFGPMGAETALEEAFGSRRPAGDVNVLAPILESMGSSSITLLRGVVEGDDIALRGPAARALQRLTGEQVPIGGAEATEPTRTIDWAALSRLGRMPRVRIQTDRGDIVLRLLTEQAPLTVQNFVEQVRRGDHDGTRFHRVVSNFVAQAGDFGMGDGSGTPGYQIRSEFTQLHFDRGVMGMASAGKDTEGSQFYLTHASQPHLDGGYTAFGWVEEGGGVLDRIQQGDLILRMTLED